MNEFIGKAREYLAELRERKDAYRGEAMKELSLLFRRRDRKSPEVFNESSLMFIRSFDGDIGQRPFANVAFWNSPDIELLPLTSTGVFTTELIAGESYGIRVNVRNRGDLFVPAAKVELFLTDPSIGFDTRLATKLTLGAVPQTFVPALGTSTVEFPWTVPPSESGHKCLFARVFSLSPLDVPVDLFSLDPRLDRHVAQQNLSIVRQGQAFSFNLVHRINASIRITLTPVAANVLARMQHPALAKLTPAREFPQRGWARRTQLRLESTEGDVKIESDTEGLSLSARGEGMRLQEQLAIETEVRAVLQSISAGKTRWSAHSKLVTRYRELNSEPMRSSRFVLRTPTLSLGSNEAVALHITGTGLASAEHGAFGGVTLVVAAR